ncbi:TraR/DksA family transcriptional regulator [Fodinibius salsisoli]|uniref:TraR/DksA C4-type zinc finger protein n=1 Tax=Fodinibius salsisoli TaxID=2820877 RepID=A0ABT3PSH1_9BACT|nr:TraR/DksA C4-type zinc finger protein [Fodinibius salsisoli]MCW9708797.1 TraR/DksA C4-type zinc finger protein [Fodinibius salsisoli]
MTKQQKTKMPGDHISPYNDQELEYFRQIIVNKREKAAREMKTLKKALEEERDHTRIKVTSTSHMGDVGTDAREQEKRYILHNRTRKFINYLNAALERINNKTYGICKVTGKKIAKGRLEAVPHTQLSIEAKRKQR